MRSSNRMERKKRAKRVRKQEFTWSSEETSKLIIEIEQHPHLWNENLEEYKDKNKRRNSLMQIAEIMKKTPEEIWVKWQNLRVSFNCKLRQKQQKESVSGANKTFNPKWEHFNSMLFLEKRKLPKTPSTNNLELNAEHEPSLIIESEQDFTIPIKKGKNKQNTRKNRNLQKDALINSIIQILNRPLDSCQVFGDFVAEKLRNLSERKRDRLEIMIQQAMITVQLEPEEIKEKSQTLLPLTTSTPSTSWTGDEDITPDRVVTKIEVIDNWKNCV